MGRGENGEWPDVEMRKGGGKRWVMVEKGEQAARGAMERCGFEGKVARGSMERLGAKDRTGGSQWEG